MNETVMWEILKRESRDYRGWERNWPCRRGKFSRLCTSWSEERVDHAPRSFEHRRDGKDQRRITCWKSGLFSPFHLSWNCSDQRRTNIPDYKHSDSFSSEKGAHRRLARSRVPSHSPPLFPPLRFSFHFQIAHLFRERYFRDLIGVRVGRND